MVFVIIWEMFHGRICLNWALLLLLVNFVYGFRLELMYICCIVNIRSSLTVLHGFQLLVLLPYFTAITFFVYQQNKSSSPEVKFRQVSNRCKRVLAAAKLAYANKTKQSITSQKLGSREFWRIANSVLSKGKSAVPSLFYSPEVLSSASDKVKLFPKNLSKNSNLEDSGISWPIFPSRTYLKLHNISVTPKMIKKVIMNLDSSKASGPGSKELWTWTFIHTSWTLQYVSERVFVFQIVGRSHRWSLYLRMLEKGLQLKINALLVLFLWLVKSLKKL